MKKPVMGLLVLLAPAFLLSPFLGQFPFPPYSSYSDLAITHYPNAVFLLRSLQQFHQIPLWSDTILSGYPFAANPLSGLWYPPGWVAYLFPLPLGFNLVSILHLLLGGIGMYCLLREQGLDPAPATLGGLIFEGLPRLFAHYAAGHLTLVYAVAWTPWLLLAAVRRVRSGEVGWYRFLEGIVLGMILLADVRWVAYAGLLWVAYRLGLFLRWKDPEWQKAVKFGLDMLIQVLVAFFIAAPLILPFLEYTRLSTRQNMTATDTFFLSLPPGRLLGLLFPSLDGNTEWTVYPGALATLSFLWILPNRTARKSVTFWVWMVPLTVLLALGSNLPGSQFLSYLPGFRLLRVPPRFLLLTGFGLTVLAAHLVQSLSRQDLLKQKEAFFSRLLVAGAMGFAILTAVGVLLINKELSLSFLWGTTAIFLLGLLILLRDRGLFSAKIWFVLVGFWVLADLAGVDSLEVSFRSPDAVLAEGSQAASYLSGESGLFRIYSPSYSIPQQTAARSGIQMVNGIDPLQLFDYANFMRNATGLPSKGYDVTLPSFANGQPEKDNAAYPVNTRLLGLLNVRYIAAEYRIDSERLTEVARLGRTRIYQNSDELPRAWVQPPDAPVGQGIHPFDRISVTPNRIDITATGPGLLVLSEVAYPGWVVMVDGKKENIQTIAGILRGVRLGAGGHQVSFLFQPVSVILGVFLTALAWLGLCIFTLWRKREGHGNQT